MALSMQSGPVIITGNTNPSFNQEPDSGPSLHFQGSGVLDPRMVAKIGIAPGAEYVYGFYGPSYVPLVDAVPVASAAANLVAAATATSGTAMTLLGQQSGVSPNIPVVPFGQSVLASNVVKCLAVDFGFTTGTTVATSASITAIPAAAIKFFYVGQPLIVSGAGASANNPLICRVVSIGATSIVVDTAAGQSVTGAQIGTSDISQITAWPWQAGGAVALFDATQAICRSWRVVSNNAGDTGWTMTARGYDIYGQPLTETINVSANATAWGKKAFKYFTSFTPTKSGSTTGTLSVGTSDVLGLALLSSFFEYTNIYWNQAFQTAATGWLTGDTTSPATATTGDVRGTVQLGTSGGGTGYTTSPNGSIRLAVFMSLPQYNAVRANNLNYATMFGVTQYTG